MADKDKKPSAGLKQGQASEKEGASASPESAQQETLSPNSWMPSVGLGGGVAYPNLTNAAFDLFGNGLFDTPASADFLSMASGWGVGSAEGEPPNGDGSMTGSVTAVASSLLSLAAGSTSDQSSANPDEHTVATSTASTTTTADFLGIFGSHESSSQHTEEDYSGPGRKGKEGNADAFSTQKEARSASWNALDGEASLSTSNSSSSRGTDGHSEKKSDARKLTASLGGGVTAGASFKSVDQVTDSDGNTWGSAVQGAGSGSLTVDDNGNGGLKGSGQAYAAASDDARSYGGGAGASVTKDSLSANAKLGTKAGKKGGESAHLLLGGGVSRSVKDRRDGNDTYRAYVETYNASMGGEAGSETGKGAWGWMSETAEDFWDTAGGSLGLSGSASTSGKVSYEKRLSAEDEAAAEKWGDDLYATGEFTLGGNRDGAAAVLGGHGSADAAKALENGESWALESVTQVAAEGSAGVDNIGVTAGAGKTWKRSFRVEKVAGDGGSSKVKLTMYFEEVDTSSLGAALQVLGIDNSLTVEESETDGRRLAISIDPKDSDYREVYAAFEAAQGPEDLQRLREQDGVKDRRDADRTVEGSTRKETFASGWMSVEKKSTYKSDAGLGESGKLETEGSASNSTGVSAFGAQLGGDATDAKFVQEGGGADVTTSESSSSLAFQDPLTILQNLAGLDGWDIVQKGPTEALREAVLTVETELIASVQYDALDVAALTLRAANEKLWTWCAAAHPGDAGAWSGLRRALLTPNPKAEWVEVNAQDANLVARGNALLKFVAAATHSARILHNTRDRWGIEPGADYDTREGDDAAKLGANLDFNCVPTDQRDAFATKWRSVTLAAPEVASAVDQRNSNEILKEDQLEVLQAFPDDVQWLHQILHSSDGGAAWARADMTIRLGEWRLLAAEVTASGTGDLGASFRTRLQVMHETLRHLTREVRSALAPFDNLSPVRDGTNGFLGTGHLPIYAILLAVVARWSAQRRSVVDLYDEGNIPEGYHQVSATDKFELPSDIDWNRITEIKGWFR